VLLDYPVLGYNDDRHAKLVRCEQCGTFYEMVAEDWGGPHILSPRKVRQFYPDLDLD